MSRQQVSSRISATGQHHGLKCTSLFVGSSKQQLGLNHNIIFCSVDLFLKQAITTSQHEADLKQKWNSKFCEGERRECEAVPSYLTPVLVVPTKRRSVLPINFMHKHLGYLKRNFPAFQFCLTARRFDAWKRQASSENVV